MPVPVFATAYRARTPKTMRVSIKTLAEKANLSPSTVSRALRDDPRIRPETRQRVQTLAKELGYVPSQVARSLVLRRTQTLGVVTTSVADPYVAQVLTGLEAVAEAAGYTLLLATSNAQAERELQAIESLRQRQVDGLILISSRAGNLLDQVLPELEMPVVLVNNRNGWGDHVHSVYADTAAGAELAAAHLLELGHRTIAYVGGPPGYSARERREGFLRALQAQGLRVDHRLLLPGMGEAEDGRRALPWLLDLGATAVVCYNDLTALGVLAAAAEAGVAVPQQLSVVGIDNLPFGNLSVPRLTTVDQGVNELGRQAARLILDALNGREVADVVLQPRLVVRESTGPAPA